MSLRTGKKFIWIEDEIKDLENKGLITKIRTIESPMGAKIKVDGKWVLNFCSNNYLGFANDKRLKNAAIKAINEYGIGPTAVRTIAGTTLLHKKLEDNLSKFKKTESSICFQSGFCANLATIPALAGEGDFIFSDELNHASIIDGCRLSKAEVIRFRHLDTKDLEERIIDIKNKGNEKTKKLIITDGVFSMNGDIAPLPKMVEIAQKYNCVLMTDDAHGEGVLGKNGRGVVDYFNLHGKVDVEVGTLSKAFGVIGGYVSGKKIIVDWLRQRARPFLFSSAMTIPDTAACIKAVSILSKSDKIVNKLWDNTKYFKKAINALGFNTGNTQTPIIPIMIGDVGLAKEFSKILFENGIFAMAIGYPTVPHDSARIRVIMSASHNINNLDTALKVFEKVGKKLKII